MNHLEIETLLNDYADNALPPVRRAAVERHLVECPSCREELEWQQSLRREARDLPLGIAPSRDLWPEIAARIDRHKSVEVDFRDRPTTSSSRWTTRGWLAAAAVLLIVLSSGVTALLLRSGDPPLAIAPPSTRPAEPVITALAAFRPAEAEYLRTADELTAMLEAQRDVLAPETVATIEENLRIIDQAITEARTALLADPQNRELSDMLSGVYRRKVELLQSAVLLSQS